MFMFFRKMNLRKKGIILIIVFAVSIISAGCSQYYFSAKTLEKNKCEFAVGSNIGIVASEGAFYTYPWINPMHAFLRCGFANGFNANIGVGFFNYYPLQLSLGVTKRIKMYENKISQTSIGLQISLSRIDTKGLYASLNHYSSSPGSRSGITSRLILGIDYVDNGYEYSNYLKMISLAGQVATEIRIFKGLHIMPYLTIKAGTNLGKPETFIYGIQGGLTLFIR